MPELSADEQRYLLAAFIAIPQDWFRPQAVGRDLAFSERQSDDIAQTLAAAGMLVASPQCHARLTEPGRKEGARLASAGRRISRRWRGTAATNSRFVAVAWLAVLLCVVIALFCFTNIL
jgi:Mn-dependent DtxR family transcriptional regulator